MARYAITILAIAAIIFAAVDSAGAAPPKELSVLAYNTHLFEDAIVECVCRCGELSDPPACIWATMNFEDKLRRVEIVNRVAESGADIVVLQEVWARCWQRRFIKDLAATYPHSYNWDSSYPCEDAIKTYYRLWECLYYDDPLKCLFATCPVMIQYCRFDGCEADPNTLGNGLVLLSKWPLENIGFERFPTFEQCSIGGCETWSDKGVLTATVDVNGVPIRIGISHGLTRPHDEKSKWDTDHIATATTPFRLNGEPYIFALKKDNTGRIVRMEDYGKWWDEKEHKYNYGAGWKHVWDAPPVLDFDVVTSFELEGHPYLFAGSNTARRAYIFRINDDPLTGWTTMYVGAWDVNTPHSVNTELVAWYRFQNNADDSSRNNDGTPYGKPTYSSDCKEDTRSINLDGDDDYVTVGDVGIGGNSPRTIAGWVRATKPADEIPGWTNVFGFTGDPVGNRHFDIQRNGRSDHYCIHVYGWEQNIIPLDQEWHHLAATYEETTIAWYADGHQVGYAARDLNIYDNVQIGKRADNEAFFPGLVDDVRIYSRALSQDDIGYLAGLGYNAVESFELDGHPYLFRLGHDGQAHIDRIIDDPYVAWQEVCQGLWSPNDVEYVETAVTSFQLDGDPYIFTLATSGRAYINRINDDPCTGWTHVYEGDWGCNNDIVTSFELYGHPYLFGLNYQKLLRINDDPCTGWTYTYEGPLDANLTAWYRFEFNTNDSSGNGYHGRPYNGPGYSSHSKEGTWSIELDGFDDYVTLGAFGIDGNSPRTIAGWVKATKPAADMQGWRGIFGFTGGDVAYTHFDIERHGGRDYYCIHVHSWEGDIAPLDMEWHHFAATYDGKTIAWYADGSLVGSEDIALNTNNHVQIGKRLDIETSCFPGLVDDVRIYRRALSEDEIGYLGGLGYSAVKSFEMNGHPYLLALRNCCDQFMDSTLCRRRPGEAYLKRINDDPCTGCEDLLQLEDIKIIRDRTVVDEDGPPAIMMGDFNIHAHKYGIMDQLFRKAGAVDAYIEVHGTGEGGETVDLRNNKFHQVLCQDDPTTPGDECNPDDPRVYTRGRIDYVYVRQSGAGLRLVPTEAHVIRDWQYGAEDMDLSDHYPVFVKFKLFEGGCTARMKGDLNCDRLINFADLAILGSAWMSGPGDGTWDPACDISEPADDFIDTKDVDVIARSWLTMPVHNVTRNTWYGFIQSAIYDANDEDEIEVAPGTYYEAINFKGKAITLYSSAGPNDTTIDGTGLSSSVIMCISGEDANTVVSGFTITGGTGTRNPYGQICGGGMYNLNSSPTVTNCNFTTNSVTVDGGGMYNLNSSPTVTSCIFISNTAYVGGGMYNNNNSNPTVTDCTFSGNEAGDGGGMYNLGSSSPMVTDCHFTGNTASIGGGMINAASSPTVTNCTFLANTASDKGGGMYNFSDSSPTLTNCTFSGNSAGHGGGTANSYSSPTMTNCTFSGNVAQWCGGGMRNFNNSSPALINCTFSDNKAADGAGMWNRYNSDPNVDNCTFSGNTVKHNGGGMYNTDSSPTVTDCNFNGNKATENGGGICNFDGSATKVTNCTFSNNSATDRGGGMYNYNSSPTVTNCAFNSNLAQTYGGGMFNISSSPAVTNCIFNNNESQLSGGGIANYSGSHSKISNCTFSGNTTGVDGGGMRNWSSSPTVTNCTFSGNTATGDGGGMSNLDSSSPTVTNCTFSGNTAGSDGGGMDNRAGSNPKVTNCTFSNNSATDRGGGMDNYNSSPTVTNCAFNSNLAQTYGGGMFNISSSPAVTNCIFNKNESQLSGGGIANYNGSDSLITNCTFSGNVTVSGDGGGIRNWDSNPIVKNCILWGNEHDEISSAGTIAPVVKYSDIRGGHIGAGNINIDPNFVDANNPDPNLVNLRLLSDSPCIDAGDNIAIPPDTADLDGDGDTTEPTPFDLDGGPRVWNGIVDMGAYEYLTPPPPISGADSFEYLTMICADWLAGTKPEL